VLKAGQSVILALVFAAVGALKVVDGGGDLLLHLVALLPFARGLGRVLEPAGSAAHDAGVGAVTVAVAGYVIARANRTWKDHR
jgi:hypothetical protein